MAKSKKEEKKVSIFDPSVDAYREYPLSKAKKFVETLEQAKKAVKEAEKENEK